MGLLDSPYVGQLVKTGTITATKSSSGYLDNNSLDCKGYNTCLFNVTVNSGSLSSSKYLQLRGQLGTSSLQPMSIYKIPVELTTDTLSGVTEVKKIDTGGHYVSSDLSSIIDLAFYIVTSEEVSVTVNYWLCNSTFINKVINKSISNLGSKVDEFKESVLYNDRLIKTETIDCSDTGSHLITGLRELYNGKKYLRLSIEYSDTDSNLSAYIQAYKQSSSVRYKPTFIREDGIFVDNYFNPKDSSSKNRNYYILNPEDNLFFRVDVAGASGLTCTVKIYATDYYPEPVHIQRIYTELVSNSTSSQTKTVTLSPELMKNFKFMFFSVGSGTNLSYNITGSIAKNWITNEEDDSETLIEFSSKKYVVTKWYPVNAISGKITFTLTSSLNSGSYEIEIYGVV